MTATASMKGYALAFFILALCLTLSSSAFSQTIIVLGEGKETKLDLTVGKSVILKSSQAIKYARIADPAVAECDLVVHTDPTEIYVTAKAPGATRLVISVVGKPEFTYDLTVAYDTAGLKQKLNEVMPEEENIQVVATNQSLTLSGRISSTAKLSQALAIAEGFAPKGPKGGINNLLEVAGVHQVMLEVRVAEMSKNLTKQLGFNFAYTQGGNFGISQLAGLGALGSGTGGSVPVGPLSLLVSPAVSALFRYSQGKATWTNFIDALQQDGLVKILAEPTLIALSGQSANFLAGGQYPVPVPQGLGTVAIQYQSYGVTLSFTPIVLEDKKINIKVAPEVSELDYSTAISYSGYVVPGLSTRKASTTVELGDGQSFAIAGLLSDNTLETLSKYPFLGNLPVLGPLFRSINYQKKETELIIIVTPHIVKPLDMAKQPLPTDYYVEPNAWEFWGLGLMEGRDKPSSSTASGELDGEFGHAVPLP
jgi:pilus assembly protein CpaC